ncbi:hypothetical protein GGX14DRAFT_546778 [Mycena pura]|uniref:Uncharacterized protein n=1 Tax=Mycena pura TaxID=153505 RepID=A0AAD6UN79_9AGAR|nr:hypothetical protein GGX14DRAFT_546778 [Mycena pura]
MMALYRKKLNNASSIYLVATAVSMFAIITTRCMIEVVGCVTNFDNPLDILGTVQGSAFKIELFFSLLVAVADAFIVFRTYIVWNRNWIVTAVPAALYLTGCGMSIWSLVLLKRLGPEENILVQQSVLNPGDAFLILTLCTNIVCTLGLVIRANLNLAPAAIYTLLLVGLLVSPMITSNSGSCLRVGRGTSYGEKKELSSAMHFATQPPTTQSFELPVTTGHATPSVGRKEVPVRRARDREITYSSSSVSS